MKDYITLLQLMYSVPFLLVGAWFIGGWFGIGIVIFGVGLLVLFSEKIPKP